MKYDVLENYKAYLYQKLSKNTARKYYSCMVKLFKDKQFNSISEVDKEFIKDGLLKVKGKNEFSAYKNGLLRMKDFYPELDLPKEKFFKQTSLKKRNRSKKPKKNIYMDQTLRKINGIRNKKLKLAYRLALVSGLRVSELSYLEAADITLDENITVNVRHGKGGSNGVVKCLPDPYLYKEIKAHKEKINPEDKLFYSEVYMREKADELGIECHDLRRIHAITYRNLLKKEMPIEEANAKVQEQLRHKRFSTTKRYLFNRKLIIKRTKGAKEEHESE